MSRLRYLVPPFVRRRVGLQLVVVCASVLAAAALVSGTYTSESQKQVVLAEVERQGQMLTMVAAMFSIEPILQGDFPSLQTCVDSLVETDRVAWAQITRADGKTVATAGAHAGDGVIYTSPIRMPGDADASAKRKFDGAIVGTVQVELTTTHAASVAAASSRAVFNQWAWTFVALSLALGLVFRFIIHGRLDRLAGLARRLGRGDLETPIRLKATDEFGQLARTLDRMRMQLRESYQDLRERNERLLELDRLKSEFLANVSHEIRTPLNGILGFAEVLLHRDLGGDVDDALETIFTSARSLRSIVDDVLEFSKLEAGEVRIQPEPVDLRDLFADIAQLFAAGAWAKRVELVIDVHPDVPARALIDPLRIRQVTSNLLSNAVKFTAEGEIVLGVQVLGEGREQQLRVSVMDTGIGFDLKTRSRLFQSFQQADGSVSRRFGGTGLGLAIARRLTERMGGAIDVESTPGVGSRFWFDIPLLPMPAAPGSGTESHGERSVVVIGVQPSLRRSLLHAVEAHGFMPLAGPEGLDGASLGPPRPYAVLLVVEDDVEECRAVVTALRSRPGASAARIVVLVPPGVSMPAADVGADEVLARPLRSSRLREALLGTAKAKSTVPTGALGRPARVLVVDDSMANCKVAAAMLKRLGHVAAIATGGAAALEILAGGDAQFDLVLMDCQMPDVDGYEATRRIRALPGPIAGIPIVACTANSLAGDDERCRTAGMDDYLAKPLELKRLGEMVANWLQPERERAPA